MKAVLYFRCRLAFNKKNCLMNLKRTFRIVFSISCVLVVSVIAVGKTNDLYGWFSWWVTDRSPIYFSGFITKVYEYRGRDSGKQRVHLSDGNGSKIVLHAVFREEMLEEISDSSTKWIVYYYPTPTGSRYICILSTNGMRVYEGAFRDPGWPGVLVFLICIFLYTIVFLLLVFFIKSLRESD